MGLDISAASHLRYARPIPRGKAFDRLEGELLSRGKSIDEVYFFFPNNQRCHRRQLGGMRPGLYAYTRSSRRHSFGVGPYSLYNWWRDQLSRFAHGVPAEVVWLSPRRYRGQPFVELIDFTDCDGRIGAPVAAKLAADFASHAARAGKFTPSPEEDMDEAEATDDWRAVYRDFARALRLAAKDGALRFC